MARSRNIKPSIMDNDQLAELDPLTRLLFIYMWMLADKAGRLEDRPKRIAAQALPFDRSCDVDAMLSSLDSAGFIRRYKAGGIACIQIVNFAKHQTPHVREAESSLPAQEQVRGQDEPKHNLGSAHAQPRQCKGDDETLPRSPDSLIPDSLIPEKNPPTPRRGNGSASAPPGFDEFWAVYPKRRNRGDAEKAWAKLKPTAALQAEILQAVEVAKARDDWRKDGGQFVPYPASWLNAKGWQDDAAGPLNGHEAGGMSEMFRGAL